MQFAGLKVFPTVAAGLVVSLFTLFSMTGADSSAAEISSGSLSVFNATASSTSSWSNADASSASSWAESSSVIIVVRNPGGGGSRPIDAHLGGFNVRHAFAGPAEDGAHPVALVQAHDGTIYGSTREGGASNAGTLFRSENTWSVGTYSVLHSFDGASGGSEPAGSLVAAADGNIYGVTAKGGAYGQGTVFRMSPSGSVTVLHSFGAGIAEGMESIVSPMTLMQASDGNFYGLAANIIKPGFAELVGTTRRAMFKMTPEGTVTVLAEFAFPVLRVVITNNVNVSDVGRATRLPNAPDTARMVESVDGTIYFVSDSKLYRYQREGNLLTQVELPAGLSEPGNLLRATNGNIYGTARVEAGSDSVLIKIAAADGAVSQLPGTLRDLRKPVIVPGLTLYVAGGPTSLTEGSNGMLYGAWTGGVGSYLFSIHPEADQSPQIFYRLPQSSAGLQKPLLVDSTAAQRSLLVDQAGFIWGLTGSSTFGATFTYLPTGRTNRPPVALDDQFITSISEDGTSGSAPARTRTLTANVLANDSDPDQDPLSIVEVTSNTGTIAEVKADGTIKVIQSEPLTGSVQVNYTVMDALGATASAKVVFPYTAPVAQDDVVRIGPVPRETLIDVAHNDSVADGGSLVITKCTRARHGRVRISEDGKSLMYKPGPFYRNGDSFEYTISDGAGGTATAKVRIENPYLGLKGDYYGLITVPETVGSVRLVLSRTGTFTAAVYYGGKIFRFRGQLSADGEADIPISRKGEGKMIFRVHAKRGQAPGVAALLQLESNLVGVLFSSTATRTAAQTPDEIVGNYTVVLPADRTWTGANYPQGDGFALLKVNAKGSAKVIGRLGDGVSFSGSTLLLADGSLPFYLDAYSKRVGQPGGVSGKLRFFQAEESDVSGKLEWTKPRQVGGAYAAGFTGKIAAVGSRWIPLEQLADQDRLWPKGATLHMGEGDLPENIKKRVDLGSGEDFVLTPVGTDRIQLKMDPKTGFFSGTFVHPESKESHPIEGVILQKQRIGAGVFGGTSTAGWVSIEPRE